MTRLEDITRSLRSSHSQWQHLTESYVIGKFVNALPREYDVPKQMLEKREDGFSREAAVSSVQKLSESYAYKQLRRSKPKSAEDQIFAVIGGVRTTPAAVDLATAAGSQADHRAAAEMVARVAEVPWVG